MNFVSLFSGIGGFDLGFINAGFKNVAAVEIDPITCKDYRNMFTEGKLINADIKDLKGDDICNQDIDVIIGGPPCQGFSQAGPRDSQDPRNQLVFEFARIVLEIKPKYFVMENVADIAVNRNLPIFKALMYMLGAEYQCHPRIVDIQNYGIPQKRKRMIVIGSRFDQKVPSFPGMVYQRNYLYDAIGDFPNLEDYTDLYKGNFAFIEYGESSQYVTDINKGYTNPRGTIYNAKLCNNSDQVRERFSDIPLGGETQSSRMRRAFYFEPSPTITTKFKIIHPYQDRLLTVRESARIMGFPDWFYFNESRHIAQKQVGNAVCPPFAEKIADEIKKVL